MSLQLTINTDRKVATEEQPTGIASTSSTPRSTASSTSPRFALQTAANLATTQQEIPNTTFIPNPTLVHHVTRPVILPSNYILLRKRLQLLAPEDDDDDNSSNGSGDEKNQQETDEHVGRKGRSDSVMSWLSWFSWYNKNNASQQESTNDSQLITNTLTQISTPFQVEHQIHISPQDAVVVKPSTTEQSTTDLTKDVIIIEQREEIERLERDNTLKDEYIRELENKVREMYEEKKRQREKYKQIKDKYEQLRRFVYDNSSKEGGVVDVVSATSPIAETGSEFDSLLNKMLLNQQKETDS